MVLSKPKPTRIRLTALDPDTGRSKTITVYDTTPEEVISHLLATLKGETRRKPKQQVA